MRTALLLIVLVLAGCVNPQPADDPGFTPSDKEIVRPYLGGFPDL